MGGGKNIKNFQFIKDIKERGYKWSKEKVAKRMYETAESIIKIADKILEEKYDPKEWVEVSERFIPVTQALMNKAADFAGKREDIIKLKEEILKDNKEI